MSSVNEQVAAIWERAQQEKNEIDRKARADVQAIYAAEQDRKAAVRQAAQATKAAERQAAQATKAAVRQAAQAAKAAVRQAEQDEKDAVKLRIAIERKIDQHRGQYMRMWKQHKGYDPLVLPADHALKWVEREWALRDLAEEVRRLDIELKNYPEVASWRPREAYLRWRRRYPDVELPDEHPWLFIEGTINIEE